MTLIYLDHAATTPVHPDVMDVMYEFDKEHFGNPSSIHEIGRKAKFFLNEARREFATSIHANEDNIIFTSGGTEANNLALIGTALENEYNGNHIITTQQEHRANISVMEYLQKRGFHVTYLPVNRDGTINVYDLERSLTDHTVLVSVMLANNETGIIQPVKEIGAILKDHQAYFHTDAVQAYSMLDIDVEDLQVDLLTASAHKLNGPKGVGFLYKREEVALQQLQYGGFQENVMRPGTENLTSVVGFQEAVKIAESNKQKNHEKYTRYKKLFIQTLEEEAVEFLINGEVKEAIPTIVNISFPGTTTDVLLTNFDLAGIAASGGSACSSGTLEPSHVLKAMFSFRDDRIKNSVRFSFGAANNEEDIVTAAKKIAEVIHRLTNKEGR